MCRFTVRPGGAQALAAGEPKLEASAPAFDLDTLFGPDATDLDASDLALLALFTGAPGATAQDDAPRQQQLAQEPTSAGSSAGPLDPAHAAHVVMGQALTAPASQQQPAPAPAGTAAPLPAPANPVQQLQFQAVMQHQAAIMQNPTVYPAAAQQMYQQALLQQQHMTLAAQQQAAAAAYSGGVSPSAAMTSAGGTSAGVLGKRGKTAEEVEEQTERIKKRRRESAQRSRQRKNAYMKSLEMENRALKLENERLRMELHKGSGAPAGGLVLAPGASPASGSSSRQPATHTAADSLAEVDGSEHLSMSDDDDEGPLCAGLIPTCLDGTAAALPDPLALLPTADLLHFAF